MLQERVCLANFQWYLAILPPYEDISLNLYCGREDTHPSLWKRFREHIIWWIRQVCGGWN